MMMREDQSECASNQCLAGLVGDVTPAIRGPIVLLRQTKVENPILTLDITTSDFTLAIDGSLDHVNNNNNSIGKDVKEPHPRKKVLGVKVSQSPQRFEEVDVPSRYPIFNTGMLCALTDVNKHPIRMHKYPKGMATSTPDPVNDKQPDISLNALGLVVEPASSNFAKIPNTSPNHPGPVLLACAGGKPLSISKLSAICDFIVKKLQPILLKAPPDCRAELMEKPKAMWAGMLEGLGAAGVKPCMKGPWAEGDCRRC